MKEFVANKDRWVRLMHGDILEGTRNMPGNREQMIRLAEEGLPGWLDELKKNPTNMWSRMDWQQHYKDLDQCHSYGWMPGDAHIFTRSFIAGR